MREGGRAPSHARAGAARHIDLDGYGLIADQTPDAAELIEHQVQFSGEVLIVRAALGDGYGRQRSVVRGLEQWDCREGGEQFSSSHADCSSPMVAQVGQAILPAAAFQAAPSSYARVFAAEESRLKAG